MRERVKKSKKLRKSTKYRSKTFGKISLFRLTREARHEIIADIFKHEIN